MTAICGYWPSVEIYCVLHNWHDGFILSGVAFSSFKEARDSRVWSSMWDVADALQGGSSPSPRTTVE
ncbi:hypothetical protein ACFX13_036542 [Malus domestica]